MRINVKAARVIGLLFLVFLNFTGIQGQETTGTNYERLLRVEIPVKSDNETYRIIPVGKSGVLVFFKSVELVDQDKVKWYFTFYDTDLKVKWSKGIALLTSLDYVENASANDTLNLLFSTNGKEKGMDQLIQFVRIAHQKNTFIGVQGKIDAKATLLDFKVQGAFAYIGYNLKSEAPRMLRMNMLTGGAKIHPLTQPEPGLITDFIVDPNTDQVYSLLRRLTPKGRTIFYFAQFDTSFKSIREIDLPPTSPEQVFTSAKMDQTGNGEFVIAGVYGTSTGQKSTSKNQYSEESSGIFLGQISNFTLSSIKTYNFLDLQNASALMGNSEMEALKRKAKKKNKELNEYSLELSLVLHPIQFVENQPIVMAESFFPQYHTENYTDFDFYGRPFTNSYNVFDGYRYQNALAIGFTSNGELAWDNTMEIRNLLAMDLSPRTLLFPSEQNMVFAYLSEGKIASKIVHRNQTVEKTDFSAVESVFSNDKLISETRSRMVRWYDSYFLCYGYQEIKNVAMETNNRRLVFYFNKIKFE